MSTNTTPSSPSSNPIRFTIGIDGGGTKTLGRIHDHQTGRDLQLKSGAASLSNDYEGAKEVIVQLLSELMAQFDAQARHTAVVMGLAGGGVKKQAQQLQKDLPFHFAHLAVFNDAKTSLIGANNGQPIATVALGTGSVGARLTERNEEIYVGGWGFPVGDGGSGAKLGFAAVQVLLDELDWHNQAKSELAKAILTELVEQSQSLVLAELNQEQMKQAVANWLTSAMAKDYAALAQQVLVCKDQCSVAAQLFSQHIQQCETLILQTRADSDLQVMLMGGLADVTLQHLTEKVVGFCQLAQGSSLDGACWLAERVYQQNAGLGRKEMGNTKRGNIDTDQQKVSAEEKQALLAQLSNMVSETPNPDSVDLDLLSTKQVLSLINSADHQVPKAIAACLDDIEQGVDLIVKSFAQQGRLIYLGAGTSGRLGILDAVECPPTFSVDHGKVLGLIAGGDRAIYKAVEGAEDSTEQGAQDLLDIDLSSKDTVVGIAASGRTPYVLGALDQAKKMGASTITLSCNPDSVLASYGEVNICPVVGPEVLTGSTRMKSGTAQKLVLNMLTTTSMIKTGKSFGNLMVDVKASNKKLYVRAMRIVMQATQCSAEAAEQALDMSGYNVKLAILNVLTGADMATAKQVLTEHNGFLRQAIDTLQATRGDIG